MPSLYLLLFVFLLGCVVGGLFMALLRRRAIEQVRREFEQELHRQQRSTVVIRERPPDSSHRAYDS